MGWLTSQYREAAPARPTIVGMESGPGLIPGVTATTALGLSAVWRCIDVLCNGVSQLPWREMRGTLDLPASRIVNRPQADRTRREWVSLVVSTLALWDVAYLLKTGGEDSEGVPLGLWPVDPNQVQAVTPMINSFALPAEFWIGQTRMTRDQLVILHRSPQPGVDDALGGLLNLARVQFAAAMAADRYASRYWQNGGNPVVALETEQHLTETEATSVQDRWAERRARGPDYAPVLSGGITAHPFGADPTAESAVEARREQVADLARYFGVPTSYVNAPAGDSVTYQTTESDNLQLVRFTLQNYIGAIEDAISDQLPGGRRMVMDTHRLTAGAQLTRAQAYQLATGALAWMTVDEVREAEGLAPQEMPAAAPAPTAAVRG
jgi:HK97 family phage portal protein